MAIHKLVTVNNNTRVHNTHIALHNRLSKKPINITTAKNHIQIANISKNSFISKVN